MESQGTTQKANSSRRRSAKDISVGSKTTKLQPNILQRSKAQAGGVISNFENHTRVNQCDEKIKGEAMLGWQVKCQHWILPRQQLHIVRYTASQEGMRATATGRHGKLAITFEREQK